MNLATRIKKHWEVYLLIVPLVLFYLIFYYKSLYGIVIAFKDLNFRLGIMGSPWVGLKHFEEILGLPDFWRAFKNSLIIAVGRIVIEFPMPIILALMLNEIRSTRLKKFYQTVYTFPHFLSWVILSGIVVNFFGSMGVFNGILTIFGMEKINLLMDASKFRGLLFGTSIWKEAGWGTIIYLATIAGVDPALYEAAEIDGANRFQRMHAVTWPHMRSTVAVLLILQIGNSMNLGGFDQVFNLYNSTVYPVADILDTYVYRRTFIQGASFSSSTAIGLFKSVINFVLLMTANQISKRMGQGGIF